MLKAITDPGELREWVEIRGGSPATVADNPNDHGTDTEKLSVHFPGYNDEGLRDIEWGKFLAKFEQRELALLYDPAKPEEDPTLGFQFTNRHRIKEGVFDFQGGAWQARGGARSFTYQYKEKPYRDSY